MLRADVAGALGLVHLLKGHLDVGQPPLGPEVDDNHAQDDAAQDADGGEGDAHPHRVVPQAGVLDDVAHRGGVAVSGVEAPDAHVAKLVRHRHKQAEGRGDGQTDHHLALVGRTGQEGGDHAVTAHLVQLKAQEHGGADHDDQHPRPLADAGAEGDVHRGDLPQPALAEKHADGARDQRGGDEKALEKDDSPAQLKAHQKQDAQIRKIL